MRRLEDAMVKTWMTGWTKNMDDWMGKKMDDWMIRMGSFGTDEFSDVWGIDWYFCHFMESVGLISVLRVLRGMKDPKVTAMKWVTRPLFIVTM